MPTDWIIYACLTAGLASALVAGVFQSFSDFVMRALVAAEPAGGIEAMQMINRTVFQSVFLMMMLGLAPVSIAFAVYAFLNLTGLAAIWIIIGAAIYVIGVFLVTMLANVPMNNRLDRMEHTTAQTAEYWRCYGVVWTRWNHLRALGSLLTAICFLLAGISLA